MLQMSSSVFGPQLIPTVHFLCICACVCSDAVLGSARAEAGGAVWGVAPLGEDGVCRTTAGVWRDWRLQGLPKLQRTGPLYWRGQFLLLMMVTDIISYGYWLKEMQPSFTDFGRPGVSTACIWRRDMANSLLPVFFFPLPVFDPIRSCRSRPTSTLLWQYSWWSIGHSVGSLWSGPMWSRASWITSRLSSGGSQRRRTKSQSQNKMVSNENSTQSSTVYLMDGVTCYECIFGNIQTGKYTVDVFFERCNGPFVKPCTPALTWHIMQFTNITMADLL